MTEPANKKSKEGRYRIDSTVVEVEPIVEPLTDLDNDEDAIDRLLINTGFESEEDFSLLSSNLDMETLDKPVSAHGDLNLISGLDAFSDDVELATLQTDDNEPVEPVDLGSPIVDMALIPTPLQHESTTDDNTASPEKDISLDMPSPPTDWNRLLSTLEDTGQHLALLENKARNAERLSYFALGLSVAALCTALTIGYLNVEVRAELSHLMDMTAILEEDVNGLNGKIGGNRSKEEEIDETPGRFSEEAESKSKDKPIAIDEPAPTPDQSIQAGIKPAPDAGSKNAPVAALTVHKAQALSPQSALKSALSKPSASKPAKPAANETGVHWSVNLVSFKQFEDARKKAAEFRRKGVSIKVMKVDIKHATWYRLSVPGFKTREAASKHLTRLKKLLRLDSLWVAAI